MFCYMQMVFHNIGSEESVACIRGRPLRKQLAIAVVMGVRQRTQ